MNNVETAFQSQSVIETGRFPEHTMILTYFGFDVDEVRASIYELADDPTLDAQVEAIYEAADEGNEFAQKLLVKSAKRLAIMSGVRDGADQLYVPDSLCADNTVDTAAA